MTDFSRRAFLSVAGLGLASLAGCGKTAAPAADPEPARRRPGENPYDIDFVTTLGGGDDLVAVVSDTPGTVEELRYTCRSYVLEEAGEGEVDLEKRALVYLPHGYDPAGAYNVLYLLHGTDGDEGYWLDDAAAGNGQSTRNILDALHDQGLIEPTIVVTPTYYSLPGYVGNCGQGWDEPHAEDWPLHFWRELRSDIVPLVESAYATYASRDVSDESLAASRDHRAFAGLSRGSVTSINSVMMRCLDWFGSIGSFSGAWADPDEFQAALEGDFADDAVRFWYNGNGSKDFSLQNHEEFVAAVLERMPGRFVDGENYAWVCLPGGDHDYQNWRVHLHNSLLAFYGA